MTYQSGVGVTITPDLDKVFARFPELYDRHMRKAMNKAVIQVQSEVKPLTPVFQARLRNSIETKVTGIGSEIKGVIGSSLSGEIYPSVMEFGRRPNSKPPPASALLRWVHLVLGVPNEEAMSVAIRIARSIGKKGIKGRFFMKRGFEAAKPKIKDDFTQGIRDLLKDIAHGG